MYFYTISKKPPVQGGLNYIALVAPRSQLCHSAAFSWGPCPPPWSIRKGEGRPSRPQVWYVAGAHSGVLGGWFLCLCFLDILSLPLQQPQGGHCRTARTWADRTGFLVPGASSLSEDSRHETWGLGELSTLEFRDKATDFLVYLVSPQSNTSSRREK